MKTATLKFTLFSLALIFALPACKSSKDEVVTAGVTAASPAEEGGNEPVKTETPKAASASPAPQPAPIPTPPPPAPAKAPEEPEYRPYFAVGYDMICNLSERQDSLRCHGSANGLIDSPKTLLRNPRLLTAGMSNACLVDDFGLKCFGGGDPAPELVKAEIKELALADSLGCVIIGQSVKCWKYRFSQVFYNDSFRNPRSLVVDDNDLYCVATDAGVKCQQMQDQYVQSPKPHVVYSVANSEGVKQIAIGVKTICGIKYDNTAQCWTKGGTKAELPAKLQNLTHPTQIAAAPAEYGKDNFCVLDNRRVKCSKDFALEGLSLNVEIERLIQGTQQICAIHGKTKLTCLDKDGNTLPAYYKGVGDPVNLGANSQGIFMNDKSGGPMYIQTGNGFESSYADAVKIGRGGYDLKCKVNAGKVECTKRYYYDQVHSSLLSDVKNAISVSVGYNHACALIKDGTIFCQGDNGYGQTGHAKNIKNAVEVAAGGDDTCAIRQDRSVTCWGYHYGGYHSEKVEIQSSNPRNLVVSSYTACAETDIGVECWGRRNKIFYR